MPRLMSSLRLEFAFPPPPPRCPSMTLCSNRIESHSFSPRKRPWEDKGEPRRLTSDEDLRSQTNGGQSTCRSLICARGPSGRCFGRYSCWQLLVSLGRRRDQQEPSCLSGDGSGRVPTRRLLAGSSPLRAVITADCVSRRLALIGLSLSLMRWGKEELAFVRLPWRRGHLMRASTL